MIDLIIYFIKKTFFAVKYFRQSGEKSRFWNCRWVLERSKGWDSTYTLDSKCCLPII